MADRFLEIYKQPSNLYIDESPAIIEEAALFKDSLTDKLICLVKMKNIWTCKIRSCKIFIRCFETSGTELNENVEFSYLDLSVDPGAEFGSKIPISVSNPLTRKIKVSFKEIVFSDDSVWSCNTYEWKTIIPPVLPDQFLNDLELGKEFLIQAGKGSKYYPQKYRNLYLCTCGEIFKNTSTICPNCHRDFIDLCILTDINSLNEKKEKRLKIEEEERQKAEEAQRLADIKNNKRKKILKFLFPVFAILIILALLAPKYIGPAVKNIVNYHRANNLLETGAFDEAEEAFLALGEYKDSSELAKEAKYRKALELKNNENYLNARDLFNQITSYKDSKDQSSECTELQKEKDYQNCISLYNEQKYAEALKGFETLKTYKESPSYVKKSAYNFAGELLKQEKYDDSIKNYSKAKGYKDADTLINEARYQYAQKLISQKKYTDALNYLSSAGDYKDCKNLLESTRLEYCKELIRKKNYEKAITELSKLKNKGSGRSLLLDAKYGYVTTHKNHNNSTTYNYLKELVNAGYSGASKIYNSLYAWKLTITAVNNSEKGTRNMSSISRHDTVYFHYKVSGGPPNGKMNITIKTKLPGTSTITNNASVYNGYEGYVNTWYTRGGNSGTSTAWFYDPNGNLMDSASVSIY